MFRIRRIPDDVLPDDRQAIAQVQAILRAQFPDVAAHDLLRLGRVAILDIDYHHGNGQQDIFYARPDVLTISIHGHPRFAYPYFTGFADEQGEGANARHFLTGLAKGAFGS